MKSKKDNRKIMVIVFAVFICLLMIASIFAIILDRSASDEITYGKYKFVRTETGYKTKIENKNMEFFYFPSDVEHINVSSDIINKLTNAQLIVFLFDPETADINNLQFVDIARFDFEQQSKVPTYSAVSQASETYASLPILSCDNATLGAPFIVLNISSDTGFAIDKDNPDCIIMNAKLKEIIAAQERLIYGAYDVIKSDS